MYDDQHMGDHIDVVVQYAAEEEADAAGQVSPMLHRLHMCHEMAVVDTGTAGQASMWTVCLHCVPR